MKKLLTRRNLIRSAGIFAPALLLRPAVAQFNACPPGFCPPKIAAIPYATFDGVATNITLSNGNLTATHANGSEGMARSTAQKNSGKWYFEVTLTSGVSPAQNDCITVIKPAATDTRVIDSGLDGGIVFQGAGGLIFANDASTGLTIGTLAVGDIIGVATDLDNDKIWFRKSPSGNWNGQVIGSQNPVGAVGGGSLSNYSATTLAPAVGFWITGSPGGVWTANFGATAFSGAVPSGFTSGWTA